MTAHAANTRMLGLSVAGLALLLGLAGCSSTQGASSAPSAGSVDYRVVSQEPSDGITIDATTEDVTIDIKSERGIGSAEILRTGPPPKTLTVNFHLKGLEEMSLAWGDTRVTAHVSSSNGSVSEEVSLAGAQATPIDNTSPYWMPIRIESENRKIPLQNGLFTVTTPPAFIQAAPARFTLKWIDFYR